MKGARHSKKRRVETSSLVKFERNMSLLVCIDTVRDQKYFHNVRNSIDLNVFHDYKKSHHVTASKHILIILVSFKN